MKKLLLTMTIAGLGLFSAKSQDLSFGVKAGVNFSKVDGDFGYSEAFYDSQETKMKTGFHVGGVAEAMLSDKFAVQAELLFSNQGYKTESTYNYGTGVEMEMMDVSLNYINIPIMAKFYPIEGLSIEAGPQVGFLISAKGDYEYTDSEFPEYNESYDGEDVKDAYKGFDFGLNFGAGYKLESGIFFQARYCLGLTEVDDIADELDEFDDLGLLGDTFSRKNRVIQLSVGFMF